jgi:hypothetical protein
VWGTACGGANCENIVWGTTDAPGNGENIVWGTSSLEDVVWPPPRTRRRFAGYEADLK